MTEKTHIDGKLLSCCGCESCCSICPADAIAMHRDREGFFYPEVDDGKCVSCGLCIRKCPVVNKPEAKDYLKTFAGYSLLPEIIDRCASGGICTALSYAIIARGGVVFGVKYDDNYRKAVYAKAETREELSAFMTSKYIQSRKNKVYAEIQKAVQSGRAVLFVGCPCDVSALNLFLGRSYENLLCCELVCMGVSSSMIAEDYISGQEKRYGRILRFNSKGKKYGWFLPCLEEEYENRRLNRSFFGTYYGRGFTSFQRPSCGNCLYRGKTGAGDLRVGDFWGIKRWHRFWNPQGVSCIFVRTRKGLDALESLRSSEFKLFEIDYALAADNNNMDSGKNLTAAQWRKREIFARLLLSRGLVPACRKTASFGFWIKHFTPPAVAEKIKHLRHRFTDAK